MIRFAVLTRQCGATRHDMDDGLLHIKDVPSVIYSNVMFDPVTRRAQAASYKFLVVRDNAFTIWDGLKPARVAFEPQAWAPGSTTPSTG